MVDDNLKSSVKSGVLWSLTGNGAGTIVSFAFGVALARLLEPEHFGIVAACLFFTEIGSTLVAASFVSTLTRRATLDEACKRTAFTLQIIAGMLAAGTLTGIAPLISVALNSEVLRSVLPLLSLNMLLLAVQGVPSAVARRAMRFRLIAMIAFIEVIVLGAVSVVLALQDFGVWSLIYGRIIGRTYSMVHFLLATRYRPVFGFSRALASELLLISVKFGMKEILDDFSKRIANPLIAALLGMSALGMYSRAFYLMTMPVERLGVTVTNVLFPAFARIQEDDARLGYAFLKTTCLLSIIVVPALLGLQAVAEQFILLVYGAKWEQAITPLEIICLAGIVYSIEAPAVSLINAKAYLAEEIARQSFHIVVLVAGVIIGSRWGLAGVSYAIVAASLVYLVLLSVLLYHKQKLTVREQIYSITPAIVAGTIMAVVLIMIDAGMRLAGADQLLLLLAVKVLTGVAVYALALYGFFRIATLELWTDCRAELEHELVQRVARLINKLKTHYA